ncbi:unnamed protein product [Victoria cruziana]
MAFWVSNKQMDADEH